MLQFLTHCIHLVVALANAFSPFLFTSLCYAAQNVPIPAKESLCKKGCCKVEWCPLVTTWATTIHKFHGFGEGFDKTDMFKYLICNPGNLAWEHLCPSALYSALSRVKTMGTFRKINKYTKMLAIY